MPCGFVLVGFKKIIIITRTRWFILSTCAMMTYLFYFKWWSGFRLKPKKNFLFTHHAVVSCIWCLAVFDHSWYGQE